MQIYKQFTLDEKKISLNYTSQRTIFELQNSDNMLSTVVLKLDFLVNVTYNTFNDVWDKSMKLRILK